MDTVSCGQEDVWWVWPLLGTILALIRRWTDHWALWGSRPYPTAMLNSCRSTMLRLVYDCSKTFLVFRVLLLFNKLLFFGNVDIFIQDSQEEKDDTKVSASSWPGRHICLHWYRVLFSILFMDGIVIPVRLKHRLHLIKLYFNYQT